MVEMLPSQDRLEQEHGLLYPPEATAFLELTEMGKTDGVSCWRSGVVERRDGSAIEGRGLFAVEDIPENTLIAIKPGHTLTSQEVKDNMAVIQGSQQQIGPDEFLGGLTEEEVDKNLIGYNHSCDPNAKAILYKGASLSFLVTREPVPAGNEITVDYSASNMTNTHALKLCHCGAPDCRGGVTPLWDWEDEGFQEKYKGELAWFIQDAIDQRAALPPEERAIMEQDHVALKMAGIMRLLTEEIDELQAAKDVQVLLALRVWRPILSKAWDKTPDGEALKEYEQLRLKAAASFAATCRLGNIAEIGIDKSGFRADVAIDHDEAMRKLEEQVEPRLDEILRFARNLDYLFNE